MNAWSPADLVDIVAQALLERAHADDLEQAVYGFDSLDELGLHPLIQEAFRREGMGVWPEQRYPDDRERTKRSEGKRCDVVLTQAGLPIRDPLVKGTLFDEAPACDPQDGYWLEIKTVAQFESTGPFRRYSAELLNAVAKDVRKLWGDGIITTSGLLLVLFTASREIAEHDLAAWHRKCLDRGYPIGSPAVRGIAITDRIGNQWCSAAIFGVRGL
ncbi:MAG: hypothetical protein NTW19_09115 [Planctomycetota bacterium]|nr:hypothetical protein [Planctomycetota bacterium]